MHIAFKEDYYQIKGDQLRFILINDFRIEETPSFEDYSNLLEHIALLGATKKSPYSYLQTLNDVYQLFDILVEKCSDNENALTFFNMIKFKCILPVYDNKWVSIEQETPVNTPILVDNDFDLAEKFINKLNMICCVNPNHSNTLNNKDTEESVTFNQLCRIDNLSPKVGRLFSQLFGFQYFSQTVYLDLENITENLREAHNVRNLCAKLLPFVQCFLFYRKEFQSVYFELSQNARIGEKLEKMKFYSVRDLQNIYRSKHDPTMSVIVSNKTCLDTSVNENWKCFVRMDILENEKEIIKGFVKLFVRGVNSTQLGEKSERELSQFCLLIYQFSHFKIRDEDIKDIEKEHDLKLTLPQEQSKWKIPEHVFADCSNIKSKTYNIMLDNLTKPHLIRVLEKMRRFLIPLIITGDYG